MFPTLVTELSTPVELTFAVAHLTKRMQCMDSWSTLGTFDQEDAVHGLVVNTWHI